MRVQGQNMRTLLAHQADGIEYTLHAHGLAATITGGSISPRLIQFHIKTGRNVSFNRVAALSDELSQAIGVKHCRITYDGDLVKIEVPRPDPQTVELFTVMRGFTDGMPLSSAILGLDESNIPLLLELGDTAAHLLISGAPGCGKSSLARSMIACLALQNQPEELKMLLIDARGREFKDFEGLPDLLCPVVTDPRDGLHRLKWAVRHMQQRLEQGITSPHLVIFIDEIYDLMQAGSREMEQQIRVILSQGPAAGIHLVISSSKLQAPQLSGIFSMKFPLRLVGRTASAQEALTASGLPGIGAERLMACGDFLMLSSGQLTRVQSSYISPADVKMTVRHLGGMPVRAVRSGRRPEAVQQAGPAGERLTGYQSALQRRRAGAGLAYAKSQP